MIGPTMGEKPVEFIDLEEVELVHRTKKAMLIEHDDERFWVPLSQPESPWHSKGPYKSGEH